MGYARHVIRWSLRFFVLFALGISLSVPAPAFAQGGEIVDAGDAGAPPAAASSAKPAATPAAPRGLLSPSPSATEESAPRPVRGPSVRERGGRRSRGASAASGALMLTLLIGILGYYIYKRIRR